MRYYDIFRSFSPCSLLFTANRSIMDDDYVYYSPDSGSSAETSLASPLGRFKAAAGHAAPSCSANLFSFIKSSLLPPVQRLCACSEDEAILLLAAAGWQSRGVEEALFSGADSDDARAQVGVTALGAADQDALPSLPAGVRLDDTYMDDVSLEEHRYADSDACARGHWFPKSTWQALLFAAAGGDVRTALTHTRCPAAPACNERIRGRMFRAYLPPAVLARLQHFTGIAMLEKRPDLGRLCPTAGCDSVVFLPKAGSAGSSAAAARSAAAPNLAVCRNAHTFCYACGCEEHAPATCAELSAWREKERADGGTSLWVKEHTKPCPKCKTSIEKNEGCMHMTCSMASCRHEFCWLCGGAWSGHSGSYYACNRTVRSGWLDGGFSTPGRPSSGGAVGSGTVAAGGAGAGPQVGSGSKRPVVDPRLEMRRYVFHIERVREHARASDLARQGMYHVRLLRDRLVEVSGCSASLLDFMVRAQETIVRGQRAASFSYVHAWGIPTGEAATEESERYRALFADSQALMLRHLERLHSLMERRVLEEILAAPSVLHAIAAASPGPSPSAGAAATGSYRDSAGGAPSVRESAAKPSSAAVTAAENSGVILRLAEWRAQVAPLVDATARFIDAFLSAVAEGEFIVMHDELDHPASAHKPATMAGAGAVPAAAATRPSSAGARVAGASASGSAAAASAAAGASARPSSASGVTAASAGGAPANAPPTAAGRATSAGSATRSRPGAPAPAALPVAGTSRPGSASRPAALPVAGTGRPGSASRPAVRDAGVRAGAAATAAPLAARAGSAGGARPPPAQPRAAAAAAAPLAAPAPARRTGAPNPGRASR